MPYVEPPVNGAPPLEFQGRDGWDATNEGQQDPAEQSTSTEVYDATPGGPWSWMRWRKTVDGGAADMSTGQVTGAGWMPDGASDASKWKGV